MDFISIDFETANEKRASACSLGITTIKNNEIVGKKYWLIKHILITNAKDIENLSPSQMSIKLRTQLII